MTIKEVTMLYTAKVLAESGMNKAKACRALGIAQKTLYNWQEEWLVCFNFDLKKEAEKIYEATESPSAKKSKKINDKVYEVIGVFPTNEERLAYLDNPMYKRNNKKWEK